MTSALSILILRGVWVAGGMGGSGHGRGSDVSRNGRVRTLLYCEHVGMCAGLTGVCSIGFGIIRGSTGTRAGRSCSLSSATGLSSRSSSRAKTMVARLVPCRTSVGAARQGTARGPPPHARQRWRRARAEAALLARAISGVVGQRDLDADHRVLGSLAAGWEQEVNFHFVAAESGLGSFRSGRASQTKQGETNSFSSLIPTEMAICLLPRWTRAYAKFLGWR